MADEETEQGLAKKLKNICDDHGKEKDKESSSKIFHKIALLYRRKFSSKISFLQSAGLLNASLARNPDSKKVQESLQELCSHVLHRANAENQQADLVAQSKHVSESVNKMRTSVVEKLKTVTQVEKNEIEEQLIQEQKKTSEIRQLQEEITRDYIHIMKDLHDYCVCVMGNSPCKYALVGLGSLARREITPYSDFEHVIILEEGSQNMENYKDVLEYFRWFSVVFQIVIINLQETAIPSFAIPCLNDTTVENGDWFYDCYTGRGISCDGMMVHACKSPLGRQKETKKKTFFTELIKPVSQMLQYLSTHEESKQGYHLAEVLMKTCFVAGTLSIHDEFREKSKEYLGKDHLTVEETKQLEFNLSAFSVVTTAQNLSQNKRINIKRSIYRSTSIFIAALGRLHKLAPSSCLDIIDELAKKKAISEYGKKKLSYAVAFACEVRLQVYAWKQRQEDVIEEIAKTHFLRSVKGKNFVSYFQIAHALHCFVAESANLQNLQSTNIFDKPSLLNIVICNVFGLHSEFAKLVKSYQTNCDKNQKFFSFEECLHHLEQETNSTSNLQIGKDDVGFCISNLLAQLDQETQTILHSVGIYGYGPSTWFDKKFLGGLRHFNEIVVF